MPSVEYNSGTTERVVQLENLGKSDTIYSIGVGVYSSRPRAVPTMLTAYFDDSGTSPTDPVAVEAGYLATVEMWELFNQRWGSLLSRYNVKQLHRADLENFRGEFVNWEPSRRREFIKKAHSIIRRCTYVGVSLALIKADFEEVIRADSPLNKFEIFSWCVHGCLAGIRTWCDSRNLNTRIQYVFELGTKGQDQFNHILRDLYDNPVTRERNRIGGWSFQGKEVPPLQAADVIAYEFYKFIKNEVADHHKRKVRLSARDLFRRRDVELLKHFDKDSFKRFVAKWKSEPEGSAS